LLLYQMCLKLESLIWLCWCELLCDQRERETDHYSSNIERNSDRGRVCWPVPLLWQWFWTPLGNTKLLHTKMSLLTTK